MWKHKKVPATSEHNNNADKTIYIYYHETWWTMNVCNFRRSNVAQRIGRKIWMIRIHNGFACNFRQSNVNMFMLMVNSRPALYGCIGRAWWWIRMEDGKYSWVMFQQRPHQPESDYILFRIWMDRRASFTGEENCWTHLIGTSPHFGDVEWEMFR